MQQRLRTTKRLRMVLARIFPHGVRDRSRFGSVANATPKMPVDPVESMQYRSLFNQSFVDFVADLATEEQCAPFKKLMKAYLKKDIPKGDDDRYHGDDKRAAQILDTVVDAQLLAEKRIHHSQEAFERDCLKAKEWREHPMELHKLEPLTDFSDAARVLYTSRSLHEVGLRLFAEGSIVKAVGFFAAALRHSDHRHLLPRSSGRRPHSSAASPAPYHSAGTDPSHSLHTRTYHPTSPCRLLCTTGWEV